MYLNLLELLSWVQISGGYPGYRPSKNLSGGAKYCTSPPRKCW